MRARPSRGSGNTGFSLRFRDGKDVAIGGLAMRHQAIKAKTVAEQPPFSSEGR
jgi:hypothetical protein